VIREVGVRNIIVISTRSKIENLKELRVDTGDPRLDEELKGKIEVIIDYDQKVIMPVK